MERAATVLTELGVAHETRIVSAHRTPDRLADYARTAKARGLRVVIAGAGGAAHLPGMVAAWTVLPVFGVPIESRALKGMDFAAVDRADAGRRARGHAGDRRGGGGQCGAARGRGVGAGRCGVGPRLEAWRAARTAGVAEAPTS